MVASSATLESIVARIERLPFSRAHLRIAAILGTGTFFDAFDSVMIGIVLAVVIASFKITFVTAALLISGGNLGQFVGALTIGAVAERFGRKPTFTLTLAIFGVFSLLAALSWNFESLAAWRLLQGLGLGAEVPIAGALFSEFVRGKTRGKVIMAYESLFPWGVLATGLVGYPLVSILGPELSWRAMFLFGAIPLVVAAIAFRALPESPRWLASRGRLREAEEIVEEMEAEGRASGVHLPTLPIVPPVAVKRSSFAEMFSPLYAKRTALSWTHWFTTFFTVYGYSVWLPLLYVRIGGLPPSQAIFLTIIPGFASVAIAYVLSGTIDRVGRKPWFAIGYGVAFLSMIAGLVLDASGIHGWPVLFAVGLISQTACGINAVGVYLYTPELFPTRMRAWATATGSAANRIATVIAPTLVGLLLGHGFGIVSVFGMFAFVLLVGFIVIMVLGIETKQGLLEELAP